MTDAKRLAAMQAALDAYAAAREADPGGARDRMIKTEIWTPGGELAREYGGVAVPDLPCESDRD